MNKAVTYTGIVLLALGATLAGQGRDANQLLAEARKAMGGDKQAAVKALTATGRTLRTNARGQTTENEFEIALELPDRYRMRSVMMSMGSMSIFRNSGFNGGQVIEEVDRPPNLAGGGGTMTSADGGTIVVRMASSGGSATDVAKMTPEQKAAFDSTRLLSNKKDFARLALGMFASSPAAYPLELTYAGEAESADGKAEMIDIKGEGDFAARLFVDAGTHLPLMLTWMALEPLAGTVGGSGGSAAPGGIRVGGGSGDGVSGGGLYSTGGGGGTGNVSKEDAEKLQKQMEAQLKEAQAKRRTVEYRIFYADYQSVGGVMLPHRIRRAIDGKTNEEMIFESFKINPKIDAKKFQVSK
jgi:hypothetical protein